MVEQPRQHVMRVLPDRLRDDQRTVGIDATEHLDAFELAGDEAVALPPFERVRALDLTAFRGKGIGQLPLHVPLGRPAGAVGGGAEVSAGHQLDVLSGFHRERMAAAKPRYSS